MIKEIGIEIDEVYFKVETRKEAIEQMRQHLRKIVDLPDEMFEEYLIIWGDEL